MIIKKRSWRTTVGGIVTACGIGLLSKQDALPEWAGAAGTLLGIIGPIISGTFARDSKVSSEEAGVK